MLVEELANRNRFHRAFVRTVQNVRRTETKTRIEKERKNCRQSKRRIHISQSRRSRYLRGLVLVGIGAAVDDDQRRRLGYAKLLGQLRLDAALTCRAGDANTWRFRFRYTHIFQSEKMKKMQSSSNRIRDDSCIASPTLCTCRSLPCPRTE